MASQVTNEILSTESNQLAKQKVQVHKFGGSSLATTACIERVVAIIQNHCQLQDIVVVSANGDTTDALFEIIKLAREDSAEISEAIHALEALQVELINSLLSADSASQLEEVLKADIKQLIDWLKEDVNSHENDLLAFGELWSARLLSKILEERVCPSDFIDSRDFLVIDDERSLVVEQSTSRNQFNALRASQKLVVVTGYICRDNAGKTCTLGRNGSDYSATIMASLAKAGNVTLWTDVDGIYSADPRVVPSARKLHRLPSGVAKELGRLGNPVLHAKTLRPLTDHSTHLHVASSFDPEVTGTEIGKFGQIAKQELSVTYLNDLLLVTADCLKTDVGSRLLETIDVVCADLAGGLIVIKQELQKHVSQALASCDDEVKFSPVGILATVGHKVCKNGSIKARFRRSLKHIKPIAMLDSKSTHSVIAVIANGCSVEQLNNVHHDMTKDARHIGLVVAGVGNIGECFIDMLPSQIQTQTSLENLHLVGLVGSKKALVNNDGIDPAIALTQYKEFATEYDKDSLLTWISNHPYDELIVVDITPSESFSDLYHDFFSQGIHVIGANKWAASSSEKNYQSLLQSADESKALWLGNTTVGAGLPINHAIADLLNSGDKISSISGIFSGTLSWLFGQFDGSKPFSELVKEALALGLTEPDPREDLSGRDVQRKLLILARQAGYQLSLEDISVENLVPEQLRDVDTETFLARAAELDEYFASSLAQAKLENGCIRYVAKFEVSDQGIKADVNLSRLSESHAFANLTPCDNVFQVESQWYQTNPLIIRGPGAGREVTAGGIHSDLVNICQQLAGRQQQVKIKGID